MKIRNILLAALGAAVAGTAWAGNYKVTLAPFSADLEGAMVVLTNYDTGARMDSALIENGTAQLVGSIDAPIAARILIDGERGGQIILEECELTVDPSNGKTSGGGAVNAAFEKFNNETMNISNQYRAAANQHEADSILNVYNDLMSRTMLDNIDNPLGYMLLIQSASEMSADELDSFIAEHPSIGKYKRVQNMREALKRKAATQPGHKFADFEIEYDGVKHRLSDVVGKGDFVLVDFWASWCGPCIRQTVVLKDIYNKYKDTGKLKVLGVAVWDEPDNTKTAIEQHQLPWECWLNGQTVPTDIYGISGIPCIILFGPDGTILSRDLQDDALKASVDTELSKVAK